MAETLRARLGELRQKLRQVTWLYGLSWLVAVVLGATLFAGLVPPGREDVHYQARVRLDLPEQPLTVGARGEAKIAAERVTLARWLARYFARTFRLPT